MATGSVRADSGVDVVALLGFEEGAVRPETAVPTDLSVAVGRRVREARRRAGLQATALAERVGLTRDKLSKIENGQRRVSARELPTLATALRVSTQWLVGGVDPSPATLSFAHRVAASGADTRARQRAVQVLEAEARLQRHVELPPRQRSRAGDEVTNLVATEFAHAPRTTSEAQRQGQLLARRVRDALDLGATAEIGDLPSLIEMNFAADVTLSPLGEGSDGLCAHHGDQALLVANTDFTVGHVRFTLAHELGHHLLRDPREVIDEQASDMFTSSFRERRVSAFAAHLLLPVAAVNGALAWLGCTAADITGATVRGRLTLGYLMTRYGVSLQCTLSQVAAAGVISPSSVSDLKSRLRATTLVAAAGHLFTDRAAPTAVTGDRRPPARLVGPVLDAARAGHVGLHTVAALLERDSDDSLFDEVMIGDDDDPPALVAAGAGAHAGR